MYVYERGKMLLHMHTVAHMYGYMKKRQSKPDVIPEIQKFQKFICFSYDDIKEKHILYKHKNSFSPYF
jgi:hypothetical protein